MDSILFTAKDLSPEPAQTWWDVVAPCEHIAQFYDDDRVLLDSLTGYAAGGIRAGDCAVVIATPEHRAALETRLGEAGIDLWRAQAENRYIALDAETTLARFMVNQMPDEGLFAECVESLLGAATAKKRRVRAFGEMVALLWARGETAATLQLEFLWQSFCQSHAFALLCAYPKAGFTKDKTMSLAHICGAHSRVL